MDDVFCFIFELLGEIIGQFLPENKRFGKKYRVLGTITGIVVFLAIVALVVLGKHLIFDMGNMLGIIPFVFAVIMFGVYIACIYYKRSGKMPKRLKKLRRRLK